MKCFYASGSKRSAAWVLKWMPQLHKYKKGHLHKVYSGLWELQLSFCRHEVSNLGFLMFNDLLTEETESKQCTYDLVLCFSWVIQRLIPGEMIRLDPVWPPRVAEMPDTTASFRSMHLCNAAPSVLFPIYSHKIYEKHLNIVALETSPCWVVKMCSTRRHSQAHGISKLSQGNHTCDLFELLPSP